MKLVPALLAAALAIAGGAGVYAYAQQRGAPAAVPRRSSASISVWESVSEDMARSRAYWTTNCGKYTSRTDAAAKRSATARRSPAFSESRRPMSTSSSTVCAPK